MLTIAKRTLITAVLITAAWAPSAATARLNLNPTPPASLASRFASATPVQARSGHLAAPATPNPAASGTPGRPSAPAVQSGFEWGDAGIGAAGMLLLLGAGASSAAVISRRRAHQTRVSRAVRG